MVNFYSDFVRDASIGNMAKSIKFVNNIRNGYNSPAPGMFTAGCSVFNFPFRISTRSTVKWRVDFPGMGPDPLSPYPRCGGTVSVLFSPLHIPGIPRS